MLGIKPETFNVLQLSISFFLFLTAFNAQGFIVETVTSSKHYNLSEHAGYISSAIVYGVFTFATFIAPVIVNLLKPKWSLTVGVLCYATYVCGFLFLNEYFLYFSSALVGIGGSILFASQGKYIAINSTDVTASIHTSIFWAISQACLIGGGIFLCVVFSLTKNNNDDDDDISKSTVLILSTVFTAITVGAAALMAFLRTPTNEDTLLVEEQEKRIQLSHRQLLISTLKLFFTRRMIYLAFTFMYSGVILSFFSSIYSTCVSYTKMLGPNTKQYLAFNVIAIGLGQASSGFLFGFLKEYTKRISRITIALLGYVIHLFVFVAVFLNFPKNASLHKTDDYAIIGRPSLAIALICGFFLGFGDACWNTQLFACLITKYKTNTAEAFSVYKFYQCLLTSAAFFIGTVLELQWYLLILVVAGILGCIGFILAERMPLDENEIMEFENTITDSASNIDNDREEFSP